MAVTFKDGMALQLNVDALHQRAMRAVVSLVHCFQDPRVLESQKHWLYVVCLLQCAVRAAGSLIGEKAK